MTHITGTNASPLAGNLVDNTGRTDKTERTATGERPGNINATKNLTGAKSDDAAALSGTGSLLAAAATTDDVRSEKVEALKAAINNGTYNVPAADVADKLIRNMLE